MALKTFLLYLTTMALRFHLTPVRMTVKITNDNTCWGGYQEEELYTHLTLYKLVSPLWDVDLGISLLDVCLVSFKSMSYRYLFAHKCLLLYGLQQ